MMLTKISMIAVATAMLSGTAMAGVTLRDKQQAACFDDVQSLCGDFIPDVDKTEACMKTKRTQVSKGCAKWYDKPAG